MTTRGEWATQVLSALGNQSPDAQTINFLAAWSACEFDSRVTRAARYNPLATTHNMPGATNYNSVGVKDFPDPNIGLSATVRTIKNGRYPNILEGLRTNKPDTALNHVELGIWGTGGGCVERVWKNSDVRNQTLPSYNPAIVGGPTKDDTDRPTVMVDAAKAYFEARGPTTITREDSIANTIDDTIANTSEAAASLDPSIMAARVVVGGIGVIMLAIGLILIIRTYVPTQQIIKTVASAAL